MQTRGDFLSVQSATDVIERAYLDERPPNVLALVVLVLMLRGAAKSEGSLEGVIKITRAKDHDRLIIMIAPARATIVDKNREQ
jgi:hypothetical protein